VVLRFAEAGRIMKQNWKIDFRAYIISSRKLFKTTGQMLERLEKILDIAPEITAVCFRESDMDSMLLLKLAFEMRNITKRAGSKLFISRRIDIAVACGADGVQLGRRTVSIKEAKKYFPQFLIGYSAHSSSEAVRAFSDGADFITISPIFYSPGKGKPVGIKALGKVMALCKGKPVFALGGIDACNIEEVLKTGAWGAAFIRSGWKIKDFKVVIRKIKDSLIETGEVKMH